MTISVFFFFFAPALAVRFSLPKIFEETKSIGCKVEFYNSLADIDSICSLARKQRAFHVQIENQTCT